MRSEVVFEDTLHGIFLNYLKLFPNQENGTLSVLYKSPLTFDNKLDFFLILLDIDGRKQISGKTYHKFNVRRIYRYQIQVFDF